MNTYSKIANELRVYFSSHRIFRALLPLDFILLIASLAIMLLDQFFNVGGFLSAAAYYIFLLGLFLAYANRNEQYLYGGFFIYAAISILEFIRYAFFIEYGFVSFSSLFKIAIFGWLGYLVYRRTLRRGKGVSM